MHCEWYYNDYKTVPGDKDFQFVHNFYKNHSITSNAWPLIVPIIEKLNVTSLIRIKANLTPRNTKHLKSNMHVDNKHPHFKTAVFYCNTNNGYTHFKNGPKVLSKENRIVLFDGQKQHCAVNCTDEKVRVVINFNYF